MRHSTESGKAILEFAIVLPFLILTALFGADLYRTYRVRQHLNVASREAGNAAFRSCTAHTAGSQTTQCLADAAGVVLDYFSRPGSFLDGMSADIRLYEFNTPTSPRLKGRTVVGTPASRLTDEIITGLKSYNAEKGELVTVEVFYTIEPFLPIFTTEYYEATLF